MKLKLPIVGEVRTGKDIKSVPQIKAVDKSVDLLGSLLQINTGRLTNEKSVSEKILNSNTGWVYRNNDAIAQEVSKIDFELFTIGLSQGEIVYNEINEHPLLTLLDKPNEETTKTGAIYSIQSHKKLTGNAYWLKIRAGGVVTALRYLPPDKIELDLRQPTENDPTVIEAYKYKETINGKSINVTYQPEDIIHFKKPNPNNAFLGLGAVDAMADTIDLDNLTTEVMKNYLKNGAIQNFALTTDSKVTDDQIKRLNAEMQASMSGIGNAFRAPIFGGGLKPVDISYSNKEQQLLDQLQWYRDKIMIGFGNTPASLGIIEDVNRANAEATLASWLRNTVKPDMQSIVDTLNVFLVPEFGENLVLGFTDPVPEDRSDDVLEATSLYKASLISKDEARELVDMDPVEDASGGEFYSAPAPIVPAPVPIAPTDNTNPKANPDENA